MGPHLGILGSAVSWFRSYMCERTQLVMAGSGSSADIPLRFDVPQGSVLGLLLFMVYTAPLQILMKKHCVQYHKFADDLQAYVTYSPNRLGDHEHAVKQLFDLINDVVACTISRKLIKTEFLVLLSPQQLKKYGRPDNIAVDGTVIRPVMSVRNRGTHFDISLSMVSQVSAVCRKYNFHLHRIASIRAYTSRRPGVTDWSMLR